jgi:hypothetical protein
LNGRCAASPACDGGGLHIRKPQDLFFSRKWALIPSFSGPTISSFVKTKRMGFFNNAEDYPKTGWMVRYLDNERLE